MNNLPANLYSTFIPSYPHLHDDEAKPIYSNKEFWSVKRSGYVLSGRFPYPHQLLGARMFSLNTPYTNGLIAHEMGTGKTCSIAFIIEHFIEKFNEFGVRLNDVSQILEEVEWYFADDEYLFQEDISDEDEGDVIELQLGGRVKGSHILVIVERGLWTQFKKKIANVCTDLAEVMRQSLDVSPESLERRIIRAINKTYTLITPGDFIKKYSPFPEDLDGSLIFIDEIHTIRGDEKDVSSDRYVDMMKILERCTPRLIIGATGTAVWDDPSGFAQVVNLCSGKEVFDVGTFNKTYFVSDSGDWKNDEVKDEFKRLLKRNLVFSYIKSDIPYDKIINITSSSISTTDYISGRIVTDLGQPSSSSESANPLELLYIRLGQYQVECIASLSGSGDAFGKNKNKFNNFVNVSLPDHPESTESVENLLKVMVDSKNSPFRLPKILPRFDFLKDILSDSPVDPQTGVPLILHEMSGKYFVWISQLLLTPTFNSFTGNNLVNVLGGVKFMGVILQLVSNIIASREPGSDLNPLSHGTPSNPAIKVIYDLDVLLNSQDRSRRNFVVLHSKVDKSKIERLKDIFANSRNFTGQICSGIIASKKFFVGHDFLGIRNVFMITGWYNMSLIDQGKYRAIRSGSHSEDFNVYTMCTVSENNIPTIDQRMYEIAAEKDMSAKKIYRVVKELSWDCTLLYDRNFIDSTDGSRECDYDVCEWSCDNAESREVPRGRDYVITMTDATDKNFLKLYENNFSKHEVYDSSEMGVWEESGVVGSGGIKASYEILSCIQHLFHSNNSQEIDVMVVLKTAVEKYSTTEQVPIGIGRPDNLDITSILSYLDILRKLVKERYYVYSLKGIKYTINFSSCKTKIILVGGQSFTFMDNICSYITNIEDKEIMGFLKTCDFEGLVQNVFLDKGITSSMIKLVEECLVTLTSRDVHPSSIPRIREFLTLLLPLIKRKVFVRIDGEDKLTLLEELNSLDGLGSLTVFYHTLELFRLKGPRFIISPDYKKKSHLIRSIFSSKITTGVSKEISLTIIDTLLSLETSDTSNRLGLSVKEVMVKGKPTIKFFHKLNTTWNKVVDVESKENIEVYQTMESVAYPGVTCDNTHIPSFKGPGLMEILERDFKTIHNPTCNTMKIKELWVYLVRLFRVNYDDNSAPNPSDVAELLLSSIKKWVGNDKTMKFIENESSDLSSMEIYEYIAQSICFEKGEANRLLIYGYKYNDDSEVRLVNLRLDVLDILRDLVDASEASSSSQPTTNIYSKLLRGLYALIHRKDSVRNKFKFKNVNRGKVCNLIWNLYKALDDGGII